MNIYEEFTFNDAGEITFIEAWTDEASLLPMDPATDPWAEGPDVKRLSTKVPGLGTQDGFVQSSDPNFKLLASRDEDLKDLRRRMRMPVRNWLKELLRSLREHHRKLSM